MNPSLQGLYENGFIKELKQDQWKLQQDAQEPKSSQLWDLPQTQAWHDGILVTGINDLLFYVLCFYHQLFHTIVYV